MRRLRVWAPALTVTATMTVLGLLLAPVAIASPAVVDPAVSQLRVRQMSTADVAADTAAVGQQLSVLELDESEPQAWSEWERRTIGTIGVLLLVLVLLTRKMRGKAVLGVRLRKRK